MILCYLCCLLLYSVAHRKSVVQVRNGVAKHTWDVAVSVITAEVTKVLSRQHQRMHRIILLNLPIGSDRSSDPYFDSQLRSQVFHSYLLHSPLWHSAMGSKTELLASWVCHNSIWRIHHCVTFSLHPAVRREMGQCPPAEMQYHHAGHHYCWCLYGSRRFNHVYHAILYCVWSKR